MEIKIHKDGSLKKIYGVLFSICLIVATLGYLFEYEKNFQFVTCSLLLFLLLLPQLDSRPLLLIDKNGIKKKGRTQIQWSEINMLKFERKKFENSTWTALQIFTKERSKPVEFTLKRTTVIPKKLYQDLVRFSIDSDFEFNVEGLKKWK